MTTGEDEDDGEPRQRKRPRSLTPCKTILVARNQMGSMYVYVAMMYSLQSKHQPKKEGATAEIKGTKPMPDG